MSHTPSAWLPSVDQIVDAGECVILASLDVNLLLAIRQLQAQAFLFEDAAQSRPEPSRTDSIILVAETLHCLIAGYRAEFEQASDAAF